MKKKILSWALVLCLVITILPIFTVDSNAASFVFDGSKYTSDANGAANLNDIFKQYPHGTKFSNASYGACCDYANYFGGKIAESREKSLVWNGQKFTEDFFKKQCTGIKAGAHLRLSRDKYDTGGGNGHSIVLISVSSNYVCWSDCNRYGGAENIVRYYKGTVKEFIEAYSSYTYMTNLIKTKSYKYNKNSKPIYATGISLNTTSKKLGRGSIYNLKATVSPSNATNKTVTWSSNKKSIATVSSSGQVKAIKNGTATITAKTSNGKKKTCKITVVSPTKSMSTLRLYKYESGPSSSIKKGTSVYIKGSVTSNFKLSAVSIIIKNSSGKTVQSGSFNPKAYTGDLSKADVGKIYFSKLPVGSYTMYITAKDATQTKTLKKVPFKIVGTTPTTINATSVALNSGNITLNTGGTYTLKATVSPSNVTNKSVTWSSNNTSVAKVSSSGVVTAVKTGKATITAKAHNGKYATCTVTVKSPAQNVASTLTLASYTSGPGTTILRGTSIYIKGTVKSNYKISNVNISILNSSGQTIQSGSYNPNAYTGDLSKADVGNIYFSKLPAGSYTMKISATDAKQTKVLKSVAFNIYNNILYNYSGPASSIKKGTSVYIKGTLKSYHKISAVSISIYDSKNTRIQYGRYLPNAYSADFSKADLGNIYFSKLAKGNYSMVLKATTTQGTFTVKTVNFTVK